MKDRLDYSKLEKYIASNVRLQRGKTDFCDGIMKKQHLNYYLSNGIVMPKKFVDAFQEKFNFTDEQVDKFFYCAKRGKNTKQ